MKNKRKSLTNPYQNSEPKRFKFKEKKNSVLATSKKSPCVRDMTASLSFTHHDDDEEEEYKLLAFLYCHPQCLNQTVQWLCIRVVSHHYSLWPLSSARIFHLMCWRTQHIPSYLWGSQLHSTWLINHCFPCALRHQNSACWVSCGSSVDPLQWLVLKGQCSGTGDTLAGAGKLQAESQTQPAAYLYK